MELSRVTQMNAKNPIPVFGIESNIEFEPELDAKDRCCRIALCAYYKAEARSFEPGHEMEDWLAAEAEVD